MRGMRVDGRIEKLPLKPRFQEKPKTELENDFASAANAQTQAPQSPPNTPVSATPENRSGLPPAPPEVVPPGSAARPTPAMTPRNHRRRPRSSPKANLWSCLSSRGVAGCDVI